MNEVIVIAHNIRSTHNIGSLFRTCEGFGVKQLIISGYSPYPTMKNDSRLPHIAEKTTRHIHKTALGAENMVPFVYAANPPLKELRSKGYHIVGLEQDKHSQLLPDFKPSDKTVLLLGEEVAGITDELKAQCDVLIEIPMQGKKESFNVSVAAGIALYGLTTTS